MTLLKVRYNNTALFFLFTYANRRPDLVRKLEFCHCVLFHLQSIASMSPLVSQLMLMEAPETSRHIVASSPSMASLLRAARMSPRSFLSSSTKANKLGLPVLRWLHRNGVHISGCADVAGLTLYVDLAVREDPLFCALQQVVHPRLGGAHRDLTDLFWEHQDS